MQNVTKVKLIENGLKAYSTLQTAFGISAAITFSDSPSHTIVMSAVAAQGVLGYVTGEIISGRRKKYTASIQSANPEPA